VAALVAASIAGPAGATETSDRAVLDNVVKDLGLTLLSRPSDPAVRLPLNPGGWSFFGRVQPYASLGPRVTTEIDDVAGLAAPLRGPADEFSKGVGVGAGVNWHLSDRLQLFGEYQLFNMRGLGGRADYGFGSRDLESPTLKGGFSIRF
jgi:hypothetical protein